VFQTYSASGRFSPSFVIWLVLGLAGLGVAAVVYALGLKWIPLIYVSFLLTIGLGWAAGLIGQWIVKRGKVRNVGVAFGIAVLLALGGLVAKFAFQYFEARRSIDALQITDILEPHDPQPTPEQFQELKARIKNNFTFVRHIETRVEQGWNIGRGGRNGIPISGPLVYLVWLIEIGIILYFSVPGIVSSAQQPFAEHLDTWADESEVVMTLPVTDEAMVQKIEAANSVQDLLELPIPKTDQSDQFAVYTINSIPGQDLEDAYLTVELHQYFVNNEGKTEVKTKPLVRVVVITSQQRVQLKENAELMSEAIAAYRASQIEEQSNPPSEVEPQSPE
jgi:hypothetical protein